ncbi:MAG: hypothetical protein QNK37_38260 [Acidobacteriota bacterium]|nr:hypothetical protein [Acidobacteriota bacterium]
MATEEEIKAALGDALLDVLTAGQSEVLPDGSQVNKPSLSTLLKLKNQIAEDSRTTRIFNPRV